MGRVFELVESGVLTMGDLVSINETVLVFLGLAQAPMVGWAQGLEDDGWDKADTRLNGSTWSAMFLTTDGHLIDNWSARQHVRILARVEDAEG